VREINKSQVTMSQQNNLVESGHKRHDVTDNRCNMPENDDIEENDEELDPRVQDELEKLNKHTDEINKLELQLEDANCLFRTLLTDSTHQLKALSQKIGVAHIEKARPYFEALEIANKAQKECQSAATAFQRANGIHAAAKETIALAEERFLTNSSVWQFDNAWQEMLNHATMKVMEAEKQKTDSEAEHLQRAAFYTAAEQACQRLEKRLKKNVVKAQLYFEQKDAFNKTLEAQKSQVQSLQTKVCKAKSDYAKSLRMLEEISESIHAQRKVKRKLNLLREPGVGAEYACDGNSSIGAPPELDYDLDECYDRGSVVSGKSSSLGDSADIPSTEHDFKNVQAVTRTVSCPENMSIMVKNLSLQQNQNTTEEKETTTNGDTESQIMML